MATDWDVFFKEILLDDTQTRSENNGTPTKSDNYQQDLNDTLTSTENVTHGHDNLYQVHRRNIT
jgi:hypothetical protein